MSTQPATRCLFVCSLLALLNTVLLAAAPERVLEVNSEVQFLETPLEDALAFLDDKHGRQLGIVIGAGVDKRLPINFNGKSKVKEILQGMLEPHDLTYKVEKDSIRIVPVERRPAAQALESQASLAFIATRLEEVLKSIRDRQNVRIASGVGVNENLLITTDAEGKLKNVLTKMLEPRGLTYRVKNGAIHIVRIKTAASQKTLDALWQLDVPKTVLADAVELIGDRANVPVVLDKDVDPNLVVQLKTDGDPLKDVLKAALAPHDLTYRIEKDSIIIVKSSK